MDFAKVKYTKRWFAHLDLLGFTAQVEDNNLDLVLAAYEDALDGLEEKAKIHKGKGISYTWFSDTFIIYSRGSSKEEFVLVEQISRLFFIKLIYRRIPVRGALTFGDLYSQKEKNIFIGKALIDSYKYGEDQDWVGLILTPDAACEAEKHLSLKYYSELPKGVMRNLSPDNVLAYTFDHGHTSKGNNMLVNCLREMSATVPPPVREKYEKSILFAENNNHYKKINRG
tara:strand:- start:2131 stop:2811 length:681 start_codon:yes stop_codon:yes gene_type:complete